MQQAMGWQAQGMSIIILGSPSEKTNDAQIEDKYTKAGAPAQPASEFPPHPELSWHLANLLKIRCDFKAPPNAGKRKYHDRKIIQRLFFVISSLLRLFEKKPHIRRYAFLLFTINQAVSMMECRRYPEPRAGRQLFAGSQRLIENPGGGRRLVSLLCRMVYVATDAAVSGGFRRKSGSRADCRPGEPMGP